MICEEKLEKLGLNQHEAKVYIAALELGGESVQNIAKKSGVHRATTYLCLGKLKDLGLIVEIKKDKKTLYAGEYPEKLLENILQEQSKLQQKQVEISGLLPELKSIFNLSADKPRVRFFSGMDGLREVYEDTLYNNQEIFAFLSVAKIEKELLNWLYKDYAPQRASKKIKAYVIAPAEKATARYKELDAKLFKETKLVNPKSYPFSIEIDIYSNKIAMMSYSKKEMFGVIIESQEVNRTMKLIFKLIWDNIK